MAAVRRFALALVVAASLAGVPPLPAHAAPAPGGPGSASHFGLARKDCVGTSAGRESKVWFTVAGGVFVRRVRAHHRQHERGDHAVRGH
ncbi:hypothetical protein ACFSTC_41470 [Nonomuraea ferruginea]